MSNFEEAILEGGPKDGEKLAANLDYGPYITIVMPTKRLHMHANAEDHYYYKRTKETREGRRVYRLQPEVAK